MEEEQELAAIDLSHIRARSLIVKDDPAHDFDVINVLESAIVKVQLGAVSCAVAMCFESRYCQCCCFC